MLLLLLLRFAFSAGDFSGLRVKELQQQLKARGVSFADCFDKEDLVRDDKKSKRACKTGSARTKRRPVTRLDPAPLLLRAAACVLLPVLLRACCMLVRSLVRLLAAACPCSA